MSVSLRMAVTFRDPAEDPEYSVVEYDGQIQAHDDDGHPLGVIGRARAYVAYLDRAEGRGGSGVLNCLDSREETAPYLELVSLDGTGTFVPAVQRILGEEYPFSRNMLIIDRIEILPAHRGRGYGLKAVELLLEHLGQGCRVAALKPYPLQLEPKATWKPELELHRFADSKGDSRRRLTDLYAGLGFRSVGRTGLMILDLDVVRETSLEMA